MSVSDGYLAYVLEQLASLGEVRSRRLCGGAGLHVNQAFFGLIADNVLYLKADDSNRHAFEERGMRRFQAQAENTPCLPYYVVPGAVMDEPDELQRWARTSLDVARRADSVR